MKRSIFFLAFTALTLVAPVYATTYGVSFTGIVSQTQGATGQAINSTVMGHFDLDSVTGSFLDFTVDGRSAEAGYSSSATIGPALTDAIYTAQVSPVLTGASSNSTFSLDLSSLSNWPSTDTPYTLLNDKTQLMTNLDTINNPLSAFPSTFSYYTANADGTGVVGLKANLTAVTTTATPEPTTLALFLPPLVALGILVRRRA